MSKKNEEVVKKTTIVTIKFQGASSVVVRDNGLPTIMDTTENSVAWLVARGYKRAEIATIGELPPCWSAAYPDTLVA